jgi:hypothetical protein
MPDQYASALLNAGGTNLSLIVVVVALLLLAGLVVWRGTHDLDFNWGKARLKVRANNQRNTPVRRRKRGQRRVK